MKFSLDNIVALINRNEPLPTRFVKALNGVTSLALNRGIYTLTLEELYEKLGLELDASNVLGKECYIAPECLYKVVNILDRYNINMVPLSVPCTLSIYNIIYLLKKPDLTLDQDVALIQRFAKERPAHLTNGQIESIQRAQAKLKNFNTLIRVFEYLGAAQTHSLDANQRTVLSEALSQMLLPHDGNRYIRSLYSYVCDYGSYWYDYSNPKYVVRPLSGKEQEEVIDIVARTIAPSHGNITIPDSFPWRDLLEQRYKFYCPHQLIVGHVGSDGAIKVPPRERPLSELTLTQRRKRMQQRLQRLLESINYQGPDHDKTAAALERKGNYLSDRQGFSSEFMRKIQDLTRREDPSFSEDLQALNEQLVADANMRLSLPNFGKSILRLYLKDDTEVRSDAEMEASATATATATASGSGSASARAAAFDDDDDDDDDEAFGNEAMESTIIDPNVFVEEAEIGRRTADGKRRRRASARMNIPSVMGSEPFHAVCYTWEDLNSLYHSYLVSVEDSDHLIPDANRDYGANLRQFVEFPPKQMPRLDRLNCFEFILRKMFANTAQASFVNEQGVGDDADYRRLFEIESHNSFIMLNGSPIPFLFYHSLYYFDKHLENPATHFSNELFYCHLFEKEPYAINIYLSRICDKYGSRLIDIPEEFYTLIALQLLIFPQHRYMSQSQEILKFLFRHTVKSSNLYKVVLLRLLAHQLYKIVHEKSSYKEMSLKLVPLAASFATKNTFGFRGLAKLRAQQSAHSAAAQEAAAVAEATDRDAVEAAIAVAQQKGKSEIYRDLVLLAEACFRLLPQHLSLDSDLAHAVVVCVYEYYFDPESFAESCAAAKLYTQENHTRSEISRKEEAFNALIEVVNYDLHSAQEHFSNVKASYDHRQFVSKEDESLVKQDFAHIPFLDDKQQAIVAEAVQWFAEKLEQDEERLHELTSEAVEAVSNSMPVSSTKAKTKTTTKGKGKGSGKAKAADSDSGSVSVSVSDSDSADLELDDDYLERFGGGVERRFAIGGNRAIRANAEASGAVVVNTIGAAAALKDYSIKTKRRGGKAAAAKQTAAAAAAAADNSEDKSLLQSLVAQAQALDAQQAEEQSRKAARKSHAHAHAQEQEQAKAELMAALDADRVDDEQLRRNVAEAMLGASMVVLGVHPLTQDRHEALAALPSAQRQGLSPFYVSDLEKSYAKNSAFGDDLLSPLFNTYVIPVIKRLLYKDQNMYYAFSQALDLESVFSWLSNKIKYDFIREYGVDSLEYNRFITDSFVYEDNEERHRELREFALRANDAYHLGFSRGIDSSEIYDLSLLLQRNLRVQIVPFYYASFHSNNIADMRPRISHIKALAIPDLFNNPDLQLAYDDLLFTLYCSYIVLELMYALVPITDREGLISIIVEQIVAMHNMQRQSDCIRFTYEFMTGCDQIITLEGPIKSTAFLDRKFKLEEAIFGSRGSDRFLHILAVAFSYEFSKSFVSDLVKESYSDLLHALHVRFDPMDDVDDNANNGSNGSNGSNGMANYYAKYNDNDYSQDNSLELDLDKIQAKLKESEQVQAVITDLREKEEAAAAAAAMAMYNSRQQDKSASVSTSSSSGTDADETMQLQPQGQAPSQAHANAEAEAMREAQHHFGQQGAIDEARARAQNESAVQTNDQGEVVSVSTHPINSKLNAKVRSVIEALAIQGTDAMVYSEFNGICVSHGLLSGNYCIEALNEYSFETYDEPVLELDGEGDSAVVYISVDIINEMYQHCINLKKG